MSPFHFKIGFDVDGVLADFNSSYRALLERRTGKTFAAGGLKPEEEPAVWQYPTHYGFTKAEETGAWDEINASPEFWATLPEYLETRPALQALKVIYQSGYPVYFITNRMGVHPHLQTIMWLLVHGYPMPQVIVSERKGPIVAALNLTHYIDDKPENCYDVARETWDMIKKKPTCSTFMLKRRWNDYPEFLGRCLELGVTPINTIKDMFDTIAAEEKAHAIVV